MGPIFYIAPTFIGTDLQNLSLFKNRRKRGDKKWEDLDSKPDKLMESSYAKRHDRRLLHHVGFVMII